MKARILSVFLLVLAVPLACGKSESGDDDHGAPPADWATCALNSDCVLDAKSCCGTCGEPGLGDVDAVNGGYLDEHFSDVCPAPVPCPLCPFSPNPDLHATCNAGTCAAVDIRQHPSSACSSSNDCRLRVTGCCECGGSTASWDLIAINASNESAYASLVCDPGAVCAACAPVYPTDVEAYCESDGHCATRPAM